MAESVSRIWSAGMSHRLRISSAAHVGSYGQISADNLWISHRLVQAVSLARRDYFCDRSWYRGK